MKWLGEVPPDSFAAIDEVVEGGRAVRVAPVV